MSSHNAAIELHSDYLKMTDPGASGTITVDRNLAYVPIVSVAAEARTLAAPTREGVLATLCLKTDGGDVTVTVTGGLAGTGETTMVFTAAGQSVTLVSVEYGGTYYWQLLKAQGVQVGGLPTGAGTGITAGTGTVYENSVSEAGGIVTTRILIDLTGLHSEATDLDIIGVDGSANPAHIGRITTAVNGTILGGTMRCLEVPAGGDPNVALYFAAEGTGVEDSLISALTETIAFDPNADWTIDMSRSLTGIPTDGSYLYLVQGDAVGTDADYTAGKFLIELYGYR